MLTRKPLLFLAATLLVGITLLPLLSGCEGEAPTYRVGYMICNSLEETQARFDPLTAYLAEATGANLVPVYLDTADFEEAFAKGEMDFTHTNSLLFVTLAHRQGVKLIAAEKRGSFGSLSRGTIIVRKDSPIQTVEDLKDKRLVFGPQWAPFGFLSQYALLLEKEVDPEVDLGPYTFPGGTWKHEKVVYSVLYGAYDAGAAPLIDLEEMTTEGRIPPDAFRVIAQSELAPYCTFGVSDKVDPAWANKVRDALVKMDDKATGETGGEKLRVLKRAHVTGFEALTMADYDVVLEWAKQAKMPPFEEL